MSRIDTAETREARQERQTDGGFDEAVSGAIAKRLTRHPRPTAEREQPKGISQQAHEDALNELAVSMTGSVDVKQRTLVGVTGSEQHRQAFATLVKYQLQQQEKDGKPLSLDKALADAKAELRERYENALGDDKDKGKKLDVLDGYWDRRSGSDNAAEVGVQAFRDYFAEHAPDTGNKDYEHNLDALARALVGGVNIDQRTLALALGRDGPLAELYQNLVTSKLEGQGSPLNRSEAADAVNRELFERIEEVAGKASDKGGKIVDVIEGYWDRHAGKEDADALSRTAYEAVAARPAPDSQRSEITTGIDYDAVLNDVAAKMAEGATFNKDDPRKDRFVTPLTDKSIRDEYASLVYAKLEEQKSNGQPANLDAAYDAVKKELYERLPNALRNDPDSKEKMGILNNYWDKHSGQGDAGDVAHEAYAKFIAENNLTDNPDYEDNLNALALVLGGGALDDTRTLAGLKDPTVDRLYQNLVGHKLRDGVELDKAIEEVRTELFARLGSALGSDAIKDEKIGIIKNYWDKHGGELDAKRAGEAAYADYVEAGKPTNPDTPLSDEEKRKLLAPSATDIMNAETTGGKTVNQLYLERLEEAYKDEPKDSDKAKFLRLMKAQDALSGGFGFLPYYYDKTNDITNYADAPAQLTGEEFQGLVDVDRLKEELGKLAQDPEIAGDSQKLMQSAVSEIKDKQGLEDRIVATMTSPTYKDELKRADLKAENGALQRYTSDLNSLAMLDPEKAQEVQQQLSLTSTVEDVNRIIESGPQGIDASTLDQSVDDVVYTTIKASVLGSYFGEASGTLTSAFDQYMDGKKLENLTKPNGERLTADDITKLKQAKAAVETMKSIVKDALKTSITVEVSPTDRGWLKAIDDLQKSDLDKRISESLDKNQKLLALNDMEKGKVGQMLKGLASDGVFGTVGALISVVAATMTLTQAGGNDAATPAERMTSAFYLLFAVSSAPTAISAIGDPLAKLLGKPGVTQALGLDKNMSDALKGKLIPDADAQRNVQNPSRAASLYSEVSNNVRSAGGAGTQALDAYNRMPPAEQRSVLKSVERMAKAMGQGYENLSASEKIKLFGPGLKLVASSAYLGGSLLGVYMGADSIAKFDENTTPTEKTQAALSLIAGLAWTGAAGAGFVSSFTTGAVAAGASLAGTVLGGVGIVLSVIGLGIASAIQYDKQKKAADEVRQFFTDLGQDGVMQKDWGDKFNYLANVEYNYVSSDKPEVTDEWYEYYFPKDTPAWEAQPDQYREFTEMHGETTRSWWNFVNGEAEELLHGHGKEPEGDRYKPSNAPAWQVMKG